MNRALVLVNPAAGGMRAGKLWERLRSEAESLARIDVAMPAGAQASVTAVREAVAGGCERVVAVGGDGTVHLVAGALLEAGLGGVVTLGIVPAGTGSDLARALDIPREPLAALRRALQGVSRPMDAGRCSGEAASFYFVNIASAGIGGMVDELVNAMPGRGTTAFLRATLQAVRRYRPVRVSVELDGSAWYHGEILLMAVANGTTFGKGMRFAPNAVVDDGLFDVGVVEAVAGLKLLRKLPKVYAGNHLGLKEVHFQRARSVRLTPADQLPVFDVDGETYPSGPATFTILPGALRIAS